MLLKILVWIASVVVSYLIGVFAWSQIIGSIQNFSDNHKLIIPLILWAMILFVGYTILQMLFKTDFAVLLGYAISFVMVKAQGKIY